MSDAKPPGPPLVLPILLATALGVCGAYVGGDRKHIPRTDEELVQELSDLAGELNGELPEASTDTFEDVTDTEWDHPVALAENECVVLLVSASESELTLGIVDLSLDATATASTNALSYCSADEPETVVFRTWFVRSPRRVLVQERRAPAGGDLNIFTVAANRLSAEYIEERLPVELRRRASEARRRGTGDGELLVEVETSVEAGALVHPIDDEMIRAIHEAAWLGVRERQPLDIRIQDSEGHSRGTVPASIRVDEVLRAVIAALDPRVYDHCVTLEVWPHQGAEFNVGLFRYPSGELVPLLERTLSLCPEDGVTFVYGPVVDHGVVLRRSRPAARVPRVRETMRETVAFRETVDSCRSGSAQSCTQVAESYRTGDGVDQNAERVVEFAGVACEYDASRCYFYALTQDSPRDRRLLLRACGEGRVGRACVALGDRYRLGEGVPADYAMALAAYERACNIGVECGAAQNVRDLQLATSEEANEAARALGFSESADADDSAETEHSAATEVNDSAAAEADDSAEAEHSGAAED